MERKEKVREWREREKSESGEKRKSQSVERKGKVRAWREREKSGVERKGKVRAWREKRGEKSQNMVL